MKTIALTCNNCGAGLDLDDEIRFLTCKHCGARLEVLQTADAAYTKVLEQVEAVATKVEQIEYERELEKIDAELGDLTDPGGWGVVAMCGGFAVLGVIMLLVSSDSEIRASGIATVLFMGPLTLWLSNGLSERIADYQRTRLGLLTRQETVRRNAVNKLDPR